MTGLRVLAAAIIVLWALPLAAGASANIYHIAVTPNGEIIGNQTPVEVVVLMDISSEEDVTFSEDNTLKFWTDLNDAVFIPVLERNGIRSELPLRHARTMTLTSWDISYPSGDRLALKVTVRGIAPNVSSTREMTMIRIAEATPHAIIESSEVIEKRSVTFIPGAQPPEDPYEPKGSVAINSTPGRARITIDGFGYGETPATVPDLGTGTHTLILSLPGYYDTTLSFTIVERQTVNVAATLIPGGEGSAGKGTATIISEPEGAEVTIDGRPAGITPIYNIGVEAGISPVRVSLPGYQLYSADIQFIPGQNNVVMVRLNPVQVAGEARLETDPEHVLATPETCCIRCSSDPPGADISVDNLFITMTPAEICNLSPGRHEVALLLPLHKRYTTEVTLSPGETGDIGKKFTLADLSLPGIDTLIGLVSGLHLPGIPDSGSPLQEKDGDRQKAYEELVKSLEEEEK
jgi:hypothetical protein